MTDLEESLTELVRAVPGVRGIFPDRPVVSTGLTVVTAGLVRRTTGSVRIDHDAQGTTVSVRIAVDPDVPTRRVIDGIRTAVATFALPEARLRIEIAQLG